MPIENGKIHVFGGKRDKGESISQTAFREFSEELAGIISPQQIQQLKDTQKFWYAKGKYGLFIVFVNDIIELHDAPKKYDEKNNKHHTAEASRLTWQFLSSFQNANQNHIVLSSKFGNEKIPFSSMLLDIIREESIIKSIQFKSKQYASKSLGTIIAKEIQKTQRDTNELLDDEKSKFNAIRKLINKLNNENSNASSIDELIKLPEIPPKPLISIVNPNSAFYNEIIQLVDPTRRGAVKFIRKANVVSREKVWNKKLIDTNATEKKPLFHGTPDTWRATAISYHGFDLKIKLHGRLAGDGAYSSEQFSVAAGYIDQQGSILVMKGMTGGKVKTSGAPPVYVFPDVDCVIPYAIIDFGPVSENDKAYDKAHQEAKAKRKIQIQKMKKETKVFIDELVERVLRTNCQYTSKLHDFQSQIEVQNHFKNEHVIDYDDLYVQMNREIAQHNLMLPIYSEKENIIREIKQSTITIISASTGSGKSTQIPQYLLDDVLDSTSASKTVWVLQPRRINAEKLAERVAYERGSALGEEIGWRTGHGRGVYDLNGCKSKIIFMTHGLFTNLVLNNLSLTNIGAIVIDEAHERSLHVDLCLGVIKIILQNQIKTNHSPLLKLVITSATIDGNIFKEFLVDKNMNDKISCKVMHLPGLTFPVITEYRPLVETSADEIGTFGNSIVRLSAAIQAVIELIENTKSGNILVFVPGRAEANQGVRQVYDSLMEENSFLLKIIEATKSALNKCFGDGKSSSGKHEKKVEVVALFGESDVHTKEKLFNSDADQVVIFATNVAETGLTIPNICYVVDIGQNRTAIWNNKLSMNTLETGWISKSSADQRKGRAGRIRPGYCLRLYSEQEYDEMEASTAPAIHTVSIEKIILFLHNYLANKEIKSTVHYNPKTFPFIEPIDDELFDSTVKKLEMFNLLSMNDDGDDDGDGGEYIASKAGEKVNDFGIDIRLGRFLYACINFKCSISGCIIAGLLVANADRLLVEDWEHIENNYPELISNHGDHLTLLNIYKSYENYLNYSTEVQFITDLRLSSEILEEASIIINHLKSRIGDALEDPIDDSFIPSTIEKALCVAFFDQICVRGTSQTLIRLLPANEDNAWDDIQTCVINGSNETVRNSSSSSSLTNSDNNTIMGIINNNNNNDNNNNNNNNNSDEEDSTNDVIVKVNRKSIIATKTPLHDDDLIVFTSIVKTDRSSTPNVFGVSYVSREIFTQQSGEWCESVDFDKLLANAKKRSKNFPDLTKNVWLNKSGNPLQKLRTKFPNADFQVQNMNDSNKIQIDVCAKPSVLEKITRIIRDTERENTTYAEVIITLSELTNEQKTFFKPKNFNKFRSEFREKWKNIILNNKPENENKKIIINIEYLNATKQSKNDDDDDDNNDDASDDATVKISCKGESKNFISAIVGNFQAQLNNYQIRNSLDKDCELISKRMVTLFSNSSLKPNSRDNLLVLVCRFLLKNCGAKIYGGFLRDWMFSNLPPSDIDCALPQGISFAQLKKEIENFKQKYNLQFTVKKKNAIKIGYLTVCNFSINDYQADVDFVELKKPITKCDADVNNIQLFWKNNVPELEQKVPNASYTINDTINNIRKKVFTCFEDFGSDPNYAATRAKKLLDKGYNCIGGVPQAHKHLFTSEQQAKITFQ